MPSLGQKAQTEMNELEQGNLKVAGSSNSGSNFAIGERSATP
jgi:hypothetical protein